MLNRHFQMQVFCWRLKDLIMTEVVAQDDIVDLKIDENCCKQTLSSLP